MADRTAVLAPAGGQDGAGWRPGSVPLTGTPNHRQPAPSTDDPGAGRVIPSPEAAPLPKGWPVKDGGPVWSQVASRQHRLMVMVAGAQGGVGTTTVAAFLGETLAAASTGPTAAIDQSGLPWEAGLARRLLGERAGLAGQQAVQGLQRGVSADPVLGTG